MCEFVIFIIRPELLPYYMRYIPSIILVYYFEFKEFWFVALQKILVAFGFGTFITSVSCLGYRTAMKPLSFVLIISAR